VHLNGRELKTSALEKVVREETGMSRAKFFDLLKQAEKQGAIYKEKVSGLWQQVH
jgi:predicted transcriptional regulator